MFKLKILLLNKKLCNPNYLILIELVRFIERGPKEFWVS
jgi:hypothetical protein